MSETADLTLVLVTRDPSDRLVEYALRYVQSYLSVAEQDDPLSKPMPNLALFFYGDAAHIANRLRWHSADMPNVTAQWQALAGRHQLSLPVCVSAALSRGVSDMDNAQRHQLEGDNLADGFELVGLGVLADYLHRAKTVLTF